MLILYVGNIWSILGGPPLYLPPPPKSEVQQTARKEGAFFVVVQMPRNILITIRKAHFTQSVGTWDLS